MNKRILASALVSSALMMSGAAIAQTGMGKAPSETPNDTTAAPLNQPTTQGATAPAPAGSSSHGTTGTHGSTGTHSGSSTMGTTGANHGSSATGATGPSGAHNPNKGSNMQHDNANRGNAAQPSQPRPVTGG